MKPVLQKLPLSPGSSFHVGRYETPAFETPWHYHEEIEIVLCDGGFGKKFIGNKVLDYQQGDVDILGSNLPHWYRADEQFYVQKNSIKPASLVIHFRTENLGNLFSGLPEMKPISDMLELSKNGISFSTMAKIEIAVIMREMLQEDVTGRLINLFKVLRIMQLDTEKHILTEENMNLPTQKDSGRMGHILQYIMEHYQEPIRLETLADETAMAKSALCRYFKEKTKKTLVDYINEIRLEHACRMLRESDFPVSEIYLESGFTNLSNFNRQFMRKYRCSPLQYRKAFA